MGFLSICGRKSSYASRTFHASVAAVVLGLLISLAWSFLHVYGF
jgi:hypothetical protein